MSADKGRESRTDTVLEEENREIGWAVISWWDKPPEFLLLRHKFHKWMLGIACPRSIQQSRAKGGAVLWNFLDLWEASGKMRKWISRLNIFKWILTSDSSLNLLVTEMQSHKFSRALFSICRAGLNWISSTLWLDKKEEYSYRITNKEASNQHHRNGRYRHRACATIK